MPDHGITPDMVSAESSGILTVDQIPQDLIDRVVDTVRTLCGWHVWPVREETITVDSTGDQTLILPTLRLVDVLKVTARGDIVDPDTYGWSADGWLQRDRGRWPAGPRAVTVTARHGLDAAPALAAVCCQMAVRSATAQDGYTVGGISVGTRAGITPQSTEWRIIDRYRLEPGP